jgi:hypothetical protein
MSDPGGAGQTGRPLTLRLILFEGFVAGAIGAVAVAAWFLIVDTIAGRPFFTPAMLGSAVFWGNLDPSTVQITFPAVIGYTMLHALAFVAAGAAAAAFAALVEVFPTTAFLVVFLFAVFEVGFYIIVATLAQPLLGALAWSSVAVGNCLAAIGMAYYLWRAHPRIRQQLAEHPLGEPVDGPARVSHH